MDTGDRGAFMEDFGDSLNDEDDSSQTKTGRNAMEGRLDTSLQAPNANDFSNARLIEEARMDLRASCWSSRWCSGYPRMLLVLVLEFESRRGEILHLFAKTKIIFVKDSILGERPI